MIGDAPVSQDPSAAGRQLNTRNEGKPAPAAFSGAGRSLRDGAPGETTPLLSSEGPGNDRAAMRERAMQAALARERRLREEAE